MRRGLAIAFAAVVLGLALGGCMPTGYSNPGYIPTAIYDSDPCTNQTSCQARLNNVAHDGFNVVLNYAMATVTNAERGRYATDAQAVGLKVIWPLESTPNDEIPSYIGYVDSLPATAGYYLWDEPTLKEANDVDAKKRYLVASGSTKPCMIVTRLKRQADYATTCQYVGPDDYPYASPFSDPPVGLGAANAARTALVHGTQHLVLVQQAFSWSNQTCDPRWWNGSYRFPTRSEMRADRDNAMTAAHSEGKNIDIMFWFSYSCITASDAPPGFEADVAWAANGVTL